MKYIDRFPAGVYLLDFEFHPAGGQYTCTRLLGGAELLDRQCVALLA